MPRRRQGFTLIELLVVIAIIGILVALLVPAVQKVRESAAQTTCKNNLKQLALGCHSFESVKGSLPALFSTGTNDGWMVQMLPYIEQEALSSRYTAGDWTASANANLVNQRIAVVECPTSYMPRSVTVVGAAFGEVALTDYFAVTGANAAAYTHAFGAAAADLSGVFGPQKPFSGAPPQGYRLTATTDGLSNTAMLAEMSGRPWPFIASVGRVQSTAPPYPAYLPAAPASDTTGKILAFSNGTGAWAHNNNFNVSTWSADGMVQNIGACSVNCSNFRGIYSFHPHGASAAFGDGAVRLLGSAITEKVFMALLTARGAESTPDQAGVY